MNGIITDKAKYGINRPPNPSPVKDKSSEANCVDQQIDAVFLLPSAEKSQDDEDSQMKTKKGMTQ